ncbi:MAG: alpha/beta fold hydrolase [Aliifodinibius sp.]|nr:alpha/beta fold hydrolase [Fodinibius sp.]NIY28501.1 alpha/beta fold hydrolase [Fodinibius sp.]
MKKKLRGVKRRDIQLDFDLYRVNVPIRGVSDAFLSVLDLWPERARQTIMFVHGYAGVLESWEFQINYFARNYRVVAPDLRGHGQSDAPFTEYTMPEMIADLQAIVEHLELPEKFILVGHSFGGSICVEYANAYPERLEKLVLIATAGEYPLPKRVKLALQLPLDILRPLWKYRPRWDAELHVMKRMMANNMQKWQGWPLLRNITTPTLIVTAERDRYFPRYVFDEVGQMVPNAEIYNVGSAKHKVQLERHHAVNRAIERFIEGDRYKSWRGQAQADDPLKDRIWVKSYSKETPPTIPIPRRPLTNFLESAADWLPKRIATIFYGTRLTYQQLNQRVNQFAHVLHGMGIKPGDRVMVVLPNMPQLIIAYYATLKIGGVVVLPNPDANTSRIVQQVQKTGTKVLVTLTSFGVLAQAVQTNTDVEKIIFADIRQAVSGSVYKKLMARWGIMEDETQDDALTDKLGQRMSILMKDAPIKAPEVKVFPTDLATIIFTSGTIDKPKGVCLTHANLVANTLQTRHWIPELNYAQEVCLSVIPLIHSYGMTNAMNIPIALGATIVLLPVFDVQEVLDHTKKYKPTIFPGVPSMYTAINQAPNVRSYGLSSIKACVSGAAPLPIEVQEAFEKLTRGRLVEGYGLTEASPVTHANPLYGVRKPGSIGVPIPNTEAKIVDLLTGEDLPPGQIGELVIKGPQVMQGYWDQDIASDSETALKNGWLYTGDVAVCDTDGYFQIISRKRDTIMFGDYSVYPRDVEEVIYENHKVLEVAVVGVGTANGEQKVKAFVVPRPGSNLTKEELLDLCRRRLEPYAVPWEIEFREELPKSFIGKILRRLLVQEVNEVKENKGES